MRKLSKRVRVQRAKAEAEAHVRKHGLADLDDWAYSIAVHWGFEEDEPMIQWIAGLMRFANANNEAEAATRQYREEEARYRKWRNKREKEAEWLSDEKSFWARHPRHFEERWQKERKSNYPNGSEFSDIPPLK